MNVSESSERRMCTKCGLEKPLEQFRRIRRGRPVRHGDCNSCKLEYQRAVAAVKKKANLRRALGRINSAEDDKRVRALVLALIRKNGGIPGLFRMWQSEIDSLNPADKARAYFSLLQATTAIIARSSSRR